MTDKVFVDTNILVYNRDAAEPQKQKQAMNWMSFLWKEKIGKLSVQILQEFYVIVTKKLNPGLKKETARQDVRLLYSWNPIRIDLDIIENAWQMQDRYRFSWWDSLIISAAQKSGCNYILTEDLKEGQKIGNLLVINPFNISTEEFKNHHFPFPTR